VLRQSKVEIIARATTLLDPEEARAAEAMVLDRAERLTPGGLRSAIKQAVIEVAPEKAQKRREKGEPDARVQRWMEDSGNAALMGRELPPADVLAADQRITWWAKQLKKAGLPGSMDQLRARAFLDIMLGKDSRPSAHDGTRGNPGRRQRSANGGPTDSSDARQNSTDSDEPDSPGNGGSGPPEPDGPGIPPTGGAVPAGFAGRLHLTIPLTTLLDLAERPGEIAGIGPIDPALARDLAGSAAANPKTTYCLTVTDDQGHAIGHGCARAEPGNRRATAKRSRPGPPGDHDPPGGPSEQPRPGFTFRASGKHGPPGGYGVWRLATGVPGARDLRIALEPITTEECDHRWEASGHEPGVMLRHLSQIRHATCTGPTCRRPSQQCDFEHNIPYEAGGRTCLCNGGPSCQR
jgi:hypothetical protein